MTCLVCQFLVPSMNGADFRHCFKAKLQIEVISSKTYV